MKNLKHISRNVTDCINILLRTLYAYEYNFSVECFRFCGCNFHPYMSVAVIKVNL